MNKFKNEIDFCFWIDIYIQELEAHSIIRGSDIWNLRLKVKNQKKFY